ncbi:hypothetical protein C0J52_04283 [Blattella germanica]|nr:hypothetical protein C0J52_04283 [Blattella germanica]
MLHSDIITYMEFANCEQSGKLTLWTSYKLPLHELLSSDQHNLKLAVLSSDYVWCITQHSAIAKKPELRNNALTESVTMSGSTCLVVSESGDAEPWMGSDSIGRVLRKDGHAPTMNHSIQASNFDVHVFDWPKIPCPRLGSYKKARSS